MRDFGLCGFTNLKEGVWKVELSCVTCIEPPCVACVAFSCLSCVRYVRGWIVLHCLCKILFVAIQSARCDTHWAEWKRGNSNCQVVNLEWHLLSEKELQELDEPTADVSQAMFWSWMWKVMSQAETCWKQDARMEVEKRPRLFQFKHLVVTFPSHNNVLQLTFLEWN